MCKAAPGTMDFMPSPSLTKPSSAWRTYFYWLFWISVVFFTVYPLCNWLTAKRETVFSLYVSAELPHTAICIRYWP